MAASKKVTIAIGGMHCQNCVTSVQKKLAHISGVTDVAVDLEKGEAVVQGNALNAPLICTAVEELGFDASELT